MNSVFKPVLLLSIGAVALLALPTWADVYLDAEAPGGTTASGYVGLTYENRWDQSTQVSVGGGVEAGWLDYVSAGARDRGVPDALLRDFYQFNVGVVETVEIRGLTDGMYDLTLYSWDDSFPDKKTLFEVDQDDDGTTDVATTVDNTLSEQQATVSVTVSVAGVLSVTIQGDGTTGAFNGLDLVSSVPPNTAPTVDAGSDETITLPIDTVNLDGTVTDDGLPDPPGAVITTWTKVSGPGTVTFGDAGAVDTTATFSVDGTYVLQLEADDGELQASDTVTVTVDPEPAVAFDVTSSSGNEAVTPVNLSVSLSDAYDSGTVTVDYAVTGGTAVDPDDYSIAGTQLTFNAGVTQQNVVLTIVDDGIVEADETVQVTLSLPVNATLGANTVHTYTINNDDSYPSVDFDLASSSGNEAVTTVNLSVSLSASYDEIVTVPFSVTGGTAVDPDDYSIAAGPLTFNVGVTQQDVVLTVVDDTDVESDETVEVTLGAPTNATLGANTVHTYTIANDDAPGVQYQIDFAQNDSSPTQAGWTTVHSLNRFDNGTEMSLGDGVTGGTSGWNQADGRDRGAGSSGEPTMDDLLRDFIYPTTGSVEIRGLAAGTYDVTFLTGDPTFGAADEHIVMNGVDVDLVENPGSGGGTYPDDWATTTQVTLSSGEDIVLTKPVVGAGALAGMIIVGGGGGPTNVAPTVDAGSNQTITLPADTVNLDGTVSDDGLPDPPAAVTTTWSKVSGPGTVTFGDAGAVDTTATFGTDGVYVLKLEADDGELAASDTMTVTVNSGGTGGTVIQTLTIYEKDSVTTNNYPITVGLVFKRGDVVSNVTARVAGQELATQTDVKRTWSDGSVKHAVVSFLVPTMPADGSVTVEILEGGTNANSTWMSEASLLATDFEASMDVTLSGNHTISARQMLPSIDPEYWLKGEICSEFIIRDFSQNIQNQLNVTYLVRVYPSWSGFRIDTIAENTWCEYRGNLTYDFDLKFGNSSPQSVFSKTNQLHHFCARWRKVLWQGNEPPEVEIHHDIAYLMDTRVIPSYDQSIQVTEADIQQSYDHWYTSAHDIMESAYYVPGMNAAGGREEICPYPEWVARYLHTFDNRTLEVMLNMADLAGSAPAHFRESDASRPSYGHLVTVDDRPSVWLSWWDYAYQDPNDMLPPPVGSTDTVWNVDRQHAFSPSYVPYLVTGDLYYVEELYFWAGYHVADQNGYYREFATGLINDATRGEAWAIRNMADAGLIAPDAHVLEKSYFTDKVQNNLDHWYDEFVVGTPAQPSVKAFSGNDNVSRYDPELDPAPACTWFCSAWMEDFMLIVMGHLADAGEFDTRAIFEWQAQSLIDRFTHPQANWYRGAPFHMPWKGPNGVPFQTWAEVELAYTDDIGPTSFPENESPDSYRYIARCALTHVTYLTNGQTAFDFVDTNIAVADNLTYRPGWYFAPRSPLFPN